MTSDQIRDQVAKLDRRNDDESATVWASIAALGVELVPYLCAAYPGFRSWEGRCKLVCEATRYARTHPEVFELGVAALKDRGKVVRYRACGLLAYALKREALRPLEIAIEDRDEEVRQSAAAAIRAIKAGNHHLFIDRSGSAQTFWIVSDDDKAELRGNWLPRVGRNA